MNSIKLIVYILLVAILFAGYIPVAFSEDDNYTVERPQRFTGLRWVILYGSYEGIERFALQELYRMVERYQPYVPVVLPAPDKLSSQEDHLIITGTRANNPLINELIKKKYISLPDKPEGYTIACMDSPWNPERRIVIIAGTDPSGVLYGVEDFNARILATRVNPEKPTIDKLRSAFDSMEDFVVSEYPLIHNRGIWSWGYVIYDYRRFLDNMARLKMNMLVVWNDCPPLNAREIIACAHSRGIKIVFGFQWGWGLGNLTITNPEHRLKIKKIVLDNYDENYRGLGMDGIYFQTQTEHNITETEGYSTAEIVCELINDVGSELLEAEPYLHIFAGLHATSIKDRYTDLKALDPRITIVWEDAGVLPYSYTPSPYAEDTDVRKTLEYSKKLATLREGSDFAMIAKGWTTLDWSAEFEHHGSFLLGERDSGFIQDRLRQRQPLWDRINALWLKHYRVAVRFYCGILDCSPAKMTVVSLVEDGLFEESIQHSVALFAETVWNPRREEEEILELSLSPYYRMW